MRHDFDEHYWDEIWSGDRAPAMGTSTVNPYLVGEVADLPPGTALDAGCGGGAEVVWLAEQGWRVTGVDVAEAALAFADRRARAHDVADRVDLVRADVATWEPPAPYDLVTTHYAHATIPQLELYDRLASWVAPGGTLLVVGHLHHGHHHEPGHAHDQPPAEASATAATITARLDTAAVWEVVTAEETSREVAGRTTALHDVVVRARRRA